MHTIPPNPPRNRPFRRRFGSLDPGDPTDLLAFARWGRVRFRCRNPQCSCTRCYRIRSRPQTRECADCHCQVSVTAGTALAYTHLDLDTWRRLLDRVRRGPRIPTMTELAKEFGIARSSAWLLLQKVFKLLLLVTAPPDAWPTLLGIKCRRPKRTRPMVAGALPEIVALHERHRAGLDRPFRVAVTLLLDATRAYLGQFGIPPDVEWNLRLVEFQPGNHVLDHAGLWRWLWVALELTRRVSLRWLPRWLNAMIGIWSASPRRGHLDRRPWLEVLVQSPACPLTQLDPWLPG